MIRTIGTDELSRINESKGQYFFSESTMHFFRSRISAIAYKKRKNGIKAFFITSEKHVCHFSGTNEPRKYTLRVMNLKTGCVDTVSDFQEYRTIGQARTALKHILGYNL